MSTITSSEITKDPIAFLRRIKAGESLLVVEGTRTLAQVQPVSGSTSELRPYGLCAGEFKVPPDFDDPLPEDILKLFEGA